MLKTKFPSIISKLETQDIDFNKKKEFGNFIGCITVIRVGAKGGKNRICKFSNGAI